MNPEDMKPDGLSSVGDLLRRGWDHHRAGLLPQAEAIYRQVLGQHPDHPGALHLLGMLAHDCGQPASAVELFDRAIALNRSVADFHFHRAGALESLDRQGEAVAAYTAGLALEPKHAEALNNLGNLLVGLNRPSEAERACRSAIALRPDLAAPYNNLGNALRLLARPDESADAYHAALRIDPSFGDAWMNLGNVRVDQDRLSDAADAFRAAAKVLPEPASALNNLGNTLVRLGNEIEAETVLRDSIARDPSAAEPHNNLGNVLAATGRLDEASASFDRAIALRPGFAEAFSNLGNALIAGGKLARAVESFERAISLRPDLAEAYTNLGNVLKDSGRQEESVAAYRRAVELRPDYPPVRSNLLLGLHMLPVLDPASLFAEHLEFASRTKCNAYSHEINRDPDRPLRIGYVSPDLRDHPVGRFILPIFEHHDKATFEIICFAETQVDDPISRALRSRTDAWHIIAGRSDVEVAGLVHEQRIDILVDLAGHTAQNRLLVFAHKAAPVQVTYLGYPNTTGLKEIDWRLTDALADPVGKTEMLHTERLFRLPRTAWCFRPLDHSPEVAPPPFEARGFVTFGSFNNLAKVNARVIDVWTRLMSRVPDSRLLLKAGGLRDQTTCDRLRAQFVAHGIDADRIELAPSVRDFREHLAAYGRVDLALDTFPYHGTTTTCEALWMGVPVVPLEGATHVSRVGVSLLHQVALDELVARDADEYVSIAERLAGDRSRLRGLRAALRDRMRSTHLIDAAVFTRDFENALRQMWRQWTSSP